jgi:hypothetical protein
VDVCWQNEGARNQMSDVGGVGDLAMPRSRCESIECLMCELAVTGITQLDTSS